VGVITALFGLGLVLSEQKTENMSLDGAAKKFAQILNLPIIVWILTGFLVVYILFFIFPVYFNTDLRMFYLYRYIPDRYPAGSDMLYNTSAITEWLQGKNPYGIGGHFYPPLYHIVFSPLLLLGYPNNFYLMTAITILSFIVMGFVLPMAFKKGAGISVLVFFLLTGLFSYGLQFELERGQFNVLAMALCIGAIYLFYAQPAFRHLAYVLFSVSIHLKLYPAIFVVMFIKDWRDWKGNLKRLLGLGLFNLALLFAAGPDVFSHFLSALGETTTAASWTFPGNHSIKAFAYNLTHAGYADISSATLPWLKGNASPVEWILMACFAACFLLILIKTYRENSEGLNADLLMVCMLGAMLLPAVSIDYKLELLAAPMAIAFYQRTLPEKTWQKIVFILATILASLAYSMTLVPYKYRLDNGILVNGLPMLFMILICITTIHLISSKKTQAALPTDLLPTQA
jgi:hypothetical protein